MKRFITMVLVICLMLLLAGCRGDDAIETENSETHVHSEGVDFEDLGIPPKWQGEYVDDGGHVLLAIRQYLDYDNLVEFGFVSFVEGYDPEVGIAEVDLEDSDIAEELNGYFFSFLDDDTILVSDGTYEGFYTRDFDSTYDWDYIGGVADNHGNSFSDAPGITGAFYPDVDLDSSEWFEFNDDSTGVWFISDTENPFHFEIVGNSILLNFGYGQEEIIILDENTLYWAEWDNEYTKKH